MTPAENAFAIELVSQAHASDHPWPGYAAAEAFLESASYTALLGRSGLALRDKDVFGLKVPDWWIGQVDDIQTREVVNGVSVMMDAKWPVFATLADAFAARLHVLRELPRYAPALAASSGPEFIRLVSAIWSPATAPYPLPVNVAHPLQVFPSGTYQFLADNWSSAPNRGVQVLATYNSHPGIFGG
jgi:hypothetical protein